jgi:hypothetical protein
LSDQQNNKVKPAVVRKKLVKKSLKKTYPVHTTNGKSKASSFDRLSNSICKKAKINGKLSYSSVQSENDCDASSSVPSLASNFSGEGKRNDSIKIYLIYFTKYFSSFRVGLVRNCSDPS